MKNLYKEHKEDYLKNGLKRVVISIVILAILSFILILWVLS